MWSNSNQLKTHVLVIVFVFFNCFFIIWGLLLLWLKIIIYTAQHQCKTKHSPYAEIQNCNENKKLSWCWQQARRVSGQSRSTNMVPFHMLHRVSYCAIVTLSSKNFTTLKWGSKVTQGHWEWYHSIDCVWFPISVL